MRGDERQGPDGPLGQGEIETLEAELREAIQHREAELQRMREAHAEMESALRRARALLGRGADPGA